MQENIDAYEFMTVFDVYARADSKQKRKALEKAYVDLTPNKDKEPL